MKMSKGLQAIIVGVLIIIFGSYMHKTGADLAGPPFGYFWLVGLPLVALGYLSLFRRRISK